MKQIFLELIMLVALTLSFTACGDESDKTSKEVKTGGDTNNTSVNFLVNCTQIDDDKGFGSAVDVTNKTLHKLSSDANVNVWDLRDGTKRACVTSGSVEVQ